MQEVGRIHEVIEELAPEPIAHARRELLREPAPVHIWLCART